MLLISHDMEIVRRVCDEVIVMYRGEAVEKGRVESVFGNPQHVYTRLLLDCNEENVKKWIDYKKKKEREGTRMRNRWMRLTAVLAAAAMLGGMLAGCGSNDSSKSGKGETGKVQQNEDIAKFIYQVTDSFDTSINYIAASWVTYGVAETLFEVDEKVMQSPCLQTVWR